MTVLPCQCPPGVVPQILLERREFVAVDVQTHAECRAHRHAENNVAHAGIHIVGKNIPNHEEGLYDFDGRVS